MSMGLPAYTSVGSGTLQSATSGTAISASPNASTLQGDLVVMVAYVDWGVTTDRPVDAGDGWQILGWCYDATAQDGLMLAACLAPRAGASGYAGLTAPATITTYAAQTHTYRIVQPGKFALHNAQRTDNFFYNAASATALDAPAINQCYPQVIDLVGRGYWNAGTTTTVGNITNYTERFDTGSAASQIGIALNDRTAVVTGSVQNASITSALAVAKTFRFGLRAMIPIIGNTYAYRGRYGSARRIA